MGIVQVHPRVWRVGAFFPGGGYTQVYVVRGSKLALIDTGVNTTPDEDIAPALASLGLALSDVDLIINTHGHMDHLGGNAAVKDASGAQVLLHPADRPLAEAHEAHRAMFAAPFELLGLPERGAQSAAFTIRLLGRSVGVDRLLDDGDTIDLGDDVRFQVIHTPGHTPGSVSLYWERERLLVSGDAIQARGSRPGGMPLYFHAADYRRSLDRLRPIPIDLLLMGHAFHYAYPLVDPVRAREQAAQSIAESIALWEAIEEAVRAELAAAPGADNLAIARAATRRLQYRVPILLDPDLDLPHGLPAALAAHIREARAGTAP